MGDVGCRGASRAPAPAAPASPGTAAARAAARTGGIRARPAAPFVTAAAMDDALRVGELVAQAAFEPAAHARELRRVEAEALLLRHLDRDRLERLQPRGAAER